MALRLAAALRPYWNYRGHVGEGMSWLDAALARTLKVAFGGWRKAFLVDDDARLARAAGSKPYRVHRLVNGGLPVALGVWDAEPR